MYGYQSINHPFIAGNSSHEINHAGNGDGIVGQFHSQPVDPESDAKAGTMTDSDGHVLDSGHEQLISDDKETCKADQPSKQDGDVRGLLTHKKEELDRSRRKENHQLVAEVRFILKLT